MINSLWAMVQDDPVFMRRVNGWMVVFWVAMCPISWHFGWLSSTTYVSLLSLWALVSGHWAAWQAARVEVKQEQHDPGYAGKLQPIPSPRYPAGCPKCWQVWAAVQEQQRKLWGLKLPENKRVLDLIASLYDRVGFDFTSDTEAAHDLLVAHGYIEEGRHDLTKCEGCGWLKFDCQCKE